MATAEQQREYTRRYREKDPERFRALAAERTRRWSARLYEAICEAKDVPCADCGGRFPPVAMDFDHRDPAEKSFTIGARNRGLAATLAEIEKCDVVCANCHRIRTHASV